MRKGKPVDRHCRIENAEADQGRPLTQTEPLLEASRTGRGGWRPDWSSVSASAAIIAVLASMNLVSMPGRSICLSWRSDAGLVRSQPTTTRAIPD